MNENIEILKEIKKLNDDKINNSKEIKIMRKEVFKQKKSEIEVIKKLLPQEKYNFNQVCDEISKFALNNEVRTIEEAIKIINGINLFKSLNLRTGIKEKIDLPFKFIKYQVSANFVEEAKRQVGINDTDNVQIEQCKEDKTIYTIYKIQDAYYKIFYSSLSKEYYVAIYKNEYDESFYTKYNFMELFEILFCSNYKEAIVKLTKLLKIKIYNIEEFKNLCNENIRHIETNIYKYKNLEKLIKKQIGVLEKIYNVGILDYYFKKNFKNNNEIFFSTRYLAKVVQKSNSTIVPYINTFVLLGFYRKRYLNKCNALKNGTMIYKVLPITEDVLIKAESIAKKLIENKITISKINKKSIYKLFNEDMVNTVFLDNKS